MARVEIPAPGDVVMDQSGNVLSGQAVTLKLAGTATNATHYSALTGGTSTTGGLVTGTDGTIVDGSGNRRYVDSGAALDLTIAGRTRQVQAMSATVEAVAHSGLLVGASRPVIDASPFNIDMTGAVASDTGFAAFVAACAGRHGFLPDGTIKLTNADVLTGVSRSHIELAPGCTLDFSTATAGRRLGNWTGTGGDGTARVPLTANVVEGATSLSVAAGAESAFAVDTQVKIRSHAKYDPNRTRGQVGETNYVLSTSSGSLALREQIIASDPARDVTGSAATDVLTPTGWAVTGTASNDSIAFTSHSLSTGDKVQFLTLTGGTGLTTGTTYYVISTGISSLKLASSLANANAGTAIDFTTDITAATLAMEHGYVANDQVILETLTGGAGLTDGAVVFVVSPTATTFKVSLTSGGAAIDFTTDLTAARVRRSGIAYAIGDDAWVEVMTPMEDVTICGRGRLLGGGTGAAHEALRFQCCRNVRVYDLRIQKFQADALVFDDCTDCEVRGCHIEHCDSVTVGYGVDVSNASTDIRIYSNHFRGCRHAFTTGQNTRGGLPRWAKFFYNHVHDSVNNGDAVDTHASGELIEICWNTIHDSSQQGINVECSHAIVSYNTISRTADHGISIHNETAAISEYVCSHNTIKNPGTAHNCIRFTSTAGGLGVGGSVVRWIKIDGNRCEYAGTQSIVVNSTSSWRFSDVTITNNSVLRQTGTNQGIYLLKARDSVVGGNEIGGHPPTATGLALSDCINVGGPKNVVNYLSQSTGRAAILTDCVGCDVDMQAQNAGTIVEIVANTAGSSTGCTVKAIVANVASTGVKFAVNATNCTLAAGSNLTGATNPLVPGLGTGHLVNVCLPRPHLVTHNLDANYTVNPNQATHPEVLKLTLPITAIRTVTLSTTQASPGSRLRVVRTAAATGASAWNVGTGPLKALAVGQWCDVSVDAAGAWALDAFGSL